jgi:threonine/homoserine/homoserine lactone efflux protein
MGPVIGQTLPLAIGIALSPMPIIAVILMLLSPRARTNGLGFMLGWVSGVVVILVVMTLISGLLHGGQRSTPTWADWVKIILGVLLLVRGAGRWRSRDEAQDMPKWMKAIDDFGTGKSFGVGALLSSVNPKNLILGIAAGLAIGGAGLKVGGTIVVIIVFTIIASVTVALPVIAYLAAGQRLQPTLDNAKAWLQLHNRAVMAVLVIILAFVLIGKGIEGLTS